MKVVRTRNGERWIDGGAVICEMRHRPGPTHSVFDVLAGSIAAFHGGGRVAVLGFAAGGLMAPLRAMAFEGTVEAVDLDPRGVAVFRSRCAEWCGPLVFAQADAVRWLALRRGRLDLVVEDLSVVEHSEATKPGVSLEPLPQRIRGRLASRGTVVFNLLPMRRVSWRRLLAATAGPFGASLVVTFDDFENRVLIAGRAALNARAAGRELRRRLRAIGSRLADGIHVRVHRVDRASVRVLPSGRGEI